MISYACSVGSAVVATFILIAFAASELLHYIFAISSERVLGSKGSWFVRLEDRKDWIERSLSPVKYLLFTALGLCNACFFGALTVVIIVLSRSVSEAAGGGSWTIAGEMMWFRAIAGWIALYAICLLATVSHIAFRDRRKIPPAELDLIRYQIEQESLLVQRNE